MLLDIVKQIVAKEGEQILSEPKRVNAFFSDLAKDEPKPQKKAIINCLEYEVVKILKDVTKEKRANCKESLAQRLRTEEGLDIELYREAIAILCEVLFGEKFLESQDEGNDKSKETIGKSNMVETYFKLGIEFDEKGDLDLAIVNYGKAIRLDPKYVFAYYNRGDAYRMKGQYDKAIEDCNEAIKLDPKYAFTYSSRGAAYRMKGQYDKAIEDCNEAIKLDPKYAFAYGCRGEAYRMKGRYDEAIEDCDKAIKLDPKYVFAYYNRGDAYRMKGQYDEAIIDFTEAISFDPKYVYAYAWRGEIYRQLGNRDQAIQDFEKALTLDPNLDWVKEKLKSLDYVQNKVRLPPTLFSLMQEKGWTKSYVAMMESRKGKT